MMIAILQTPDASMLQTASGDHAEDIDDDHHDAAQAAGWTVMNMKEDWNKIFPFGSK
jgi:hypothetical protein